MMMYGGNTTVRIKVIVTPYPRGLRVRAWKPHC